MAGNCNSISVRLKCINCVSKIFKSFDKVAVQDQVLGMLKNVYLLFIYK